MDAATLASHKTRRRFVLDYEGYQIDLPPGELLVGRGAVCQLVLDDSLVSRRHAKLVVDDAGVIIEDLGSVNGVLVNQRRVVGQQELEAGDRILIGKQELVLTLAPVSSLPPGSQRRSTAETLHGGDVQRAVTLGDGEPGDDATHKGDALDLLGGVAEKVLALGRGEEAERILGSYLKSIVKSAREGRTASTDIATKAVNYAVKIAAATGKGSWVDYAFELYTLRREPLPAEVVDYLYEALRKVSDVDLALFRGYQQVLHAETDRFGPAERFLVQRIDGLERLVSA